VSATDGSLPASMASRRASMAPMVPREFNWQSISSIQSLRVPLGPSGASQGGGVVETGAGAGTGTGWERGRRGMVVVPERKTKTDNRVRSHLVRSMGSVAAVERAESGPEPATLASFEHMERDPDGPEQEVFRVPTGPRDRRRDPGPVGCFGDLEDCGIAKIHPGVGQKGGDVLGRQSQDLADLQDPADELATMAVLVVLAANLKDLQAPSTPAVFMCRRSVRRDFMSATKESREVAAVRPTRWAIASLRVSWPESRFLTGRVIENRRSISDVPTRRGETGRPGI
jgi:hypothetical protein